MNFSRAIYAFYFERAWREAGPYFQKAIAINPRSSLGQAYYGLFLATERRRTEEALERVTLACQMDPLSALIHSLAATTLYSLGHYEAAERAAHQTLELQPDHLFGLWVRGLSLSGLGRHEEAIDTLERAVTLARAPSFVGMLGLAYARAGRLDDASRLLHELEDRSSRGEYVGAVALLAHPRRPRRTAGNTHDARESAGRGYAPLFGACHKRSVSRSVPERSRYPTYVVRALRLVIPCAPTRATTPCCAK